MSAMGGIGQQVAGDLFELGKSVAKNTVKAVADISSDTMEQILKSPSGLLPLDTKEVGVEQGMSQNQREIQKKNEEKRRLNEVKSQLNEYIERRKVMDEQIAKEKAQEKQQTDHKKAVEKQEKETFLQKLMSRLAQGSHGETDRQKE